MNDQLQPFDVWLRFGIGPLAEAINPVLALPAPPPVVPLPEQVTPVPIQEEAPVAALAPVGTDPGAMKEHIDALGHTLRGEMTFLRDRMGSLEGAVRPIIEAQQNMVFQLQKTQQDMKGLAHGVTQMLDSFQEQLKELPIERVAENTRLVSQFSAALGNCVARLDLAGDQILFLIWKGKLAEYHILTDVKRQEVPSEHFDQARQNIDHYSRKAQEQAKRLGQT